ncbi:MAG: hypothetical protein RR923_02990 [Bacilli bacterium]
MSQEKIQEAMTLANKYGIVQNGNVVGDFNTAKSVISENGGLGILDKALNLSKNPLIKIGLKKIGMSDELINGAVDELKGNRSTSNLIDSDSGNINTNDYKTTDTKNEFLRRLEQLK